MIREYIRDANGNLAGVVVSTGPNKIGWSLCNPKDNFDKGMALLIACGRAERGSNALVPMKVWPVVNRMKERSSRYFKQGFSQHEIKA
jgi:hypothetical protein